MDVAGMRSRYAPTATARATVVVNSQWVKTETDPAAPVRRRPNAANVGGRWLLRLGVLAHDTPALRATFT